MADLFGIPGLSLAGLSSTGVLLWLLGLTIKTWLERRKLSLEDRTAMVAGFSAQADHLMQENRNLRGEVMQQHDKIFELARRHELCEIETIQLRQDVVGFKRQLHAIATAALQYIPAEQLEGTIAGAMIKEILGEVSTSLKKAGWRSRPRH